jgi:hypothetical protein
MKTKVFIDTFKGSKIFAVWEVDETYQKVGQYPLFSMGTKKAHALMLHLEEFKQYAENSSTEKSIK